MQVSQTLTMLVNIFAYSDSVKSNNPRLRDFDYARQISDVATSKTRSQQHIINIAEEETVLSMLRPLTGGASWTVSNPEGFTARYTWSGTNPVLRTERTGGSFVDGNTVSVARQATSRVVRLTFSNLLAAGIIAGDELFIGEGSGLTPLNQGIFTVVAASGNTIDVLSNDMVNETAIVATTAADVYAFSAGPVRTGDFLRVTSTAFNFGNRGDFQITKITSRFVEIQNANLVPEGPVTANVVVYDQLYKLTYIESDQKVNVYVNGSADPTVLEPIQDGEPGLVAVYLVRGSVFSVRIENVGLNAANVTTFFAT
jgi:hypothetical protein